MTKRTKIEVIDEPNFPYVEPAFGGGIDEDIRRALFMLREVRNDPDIKRIYDRRRESCETHEDKLTLFYDLLRGSWVEMRLTVDYKLNPVKIDWTKYKDYKDEIISTGDGVHDEEWV